MGEYSESNLLNSELAVKVLKKLYRKQSYGSEIARNIEKSQTSIDRVIRGLHNQGILEKGKKTKAQYYKLHTDSLVDYWYQKLLESEETNLDKDKYRLLTNKETSFNKIPEIIEANEDRVKEFGDYYLNNFFQEENKDIELRRLLFHYPYSGLNWYSRTNKLPDYLSGLFLCLESKIDLSYDMNIENGIEN